MEEREIYEILTAGWRLYRRYQQVQKEDSFWEALNRDAAVIHNKHPTPFCEDILRAVVRELEKAL